MEETTDVFILRDSYDEDYDYIFILDKKISRTELNIIIGNSREEYYNQEYEMSLCYYISLNLTRKNIKNRCCNLKDFEYTFEY